MTRTSGVAAGGAVAGRGAGGRVPAVRRSARSEQLPCGSTACLGGEWPGTLGTLRLTELRNRLYSRNRLLGTPNETSDDGPNGLQSAQHEPAVDERTWFLVGEPMQLDPPAACGGPFRRANTQYSRDRGALWTHDLPPRTKRATRHTRHLTVQVTAHTSSVPSLSADVKMISGTIAYMCRAAQRFAYTP